MLRSKCCLGTFVVHLFAFSYRYSGLVMILLAQKDANAFFLIWLLSLDPFLEWTLNIIIYSMFHPRS